MPDPVARVSASYGIKRPSDPSNTFAGSGEAHVSYSMEFDTHGMTVEQVHKRMSEEHKALHNGCVLAVCAALDVGFVTGDDGYLQATPVVVPNVPYNAAPTPRPQPAAAGSPRGGGNRGGGQSRYAPPKADVSQLPILMIDYFKNGTPIAFHDQRGLKANGTYAARAADFKSVDKFTNKRGEQDNIPLWLSDKDGNPNTWEQSLVAEAEKRAGNEAEF